VITQERMPGGGAEKKRHDPGEGLAPENILTPD
jgi:hypothetical protein